LQDHIQVKILCLIIRLNKKPLRNQGFLISCMREDPDVRRDYRFYVS